MAASGMRATYTNAYGVLPVASAIASLEFGAHHEAANLFLFPALLFPFL